MEQAERVTGIPVVGAIPNRPKFDFARAGAVLVEEPDSIIAEAIRSLRTSLYLAGRKPGRKTCLFTSALGSEGKTFSAINYSVSLAQQGLKTLLVDADLRAPTVGKILSIKETAPGLADYLAGEAIVEQIISETDIPNLFVIGAGHAISSPAELLANRAFGDLLTEVGARFDHIVIDSAPVIPVSDTLLLIEHAQTVCVVARACKTPRSVILRAIQLLAQAGGKPVGLILNQIPSGRAFGYPYKYGGYKKVGYAARQQPFIETGNQWVSRECRRCGSASPCAMLVVNSRYDSLLGAIQKSTVRSELMKSRIEAFRGLQISA